MHQRTRLARLLGAAVLSIITSVALTGCHKGRSFVVFGSGFSHGHHDHRPPRDYCPPPRDHHHGHHRGGHRY